MHDENEQRKVEYNTTPAVDAISLIRITGDIVPPIWYQKIITPTGKPHRLAISILANIFYWYRWTETRDEDTGQVISRNKKFHSDKLQKSYEALRVQFGASKLETKRAIDRLVELELITREFRNIQTKGGLVLTNVMFLELIPENIIAITFEKNFIKKDPGKYDHDVDHNRTSLLLSKDPLPQKSPPPGRKVGTYTKTTTKTTTKILSTPSPKKKKPKNRVFMIPETLADRFTDAGNVSFLNQPDTKIIPALPDYLENDGKRDNLETDIDIFFQFARQEAVSAVLLKKLNNISFILDKFDAKQYHKGRELAEARDGDKKLSYLRKVLEKAFRPKSYKSQRSIIKKNTTHAIRKPNEGPYEVSGSV